MTSGLSPSDLAATIRAFSLPHRIRRSIVICTLDHAVVGDVTECFQDGQVNISAGSEVSRSASISMFDPTHQIGLDTENPAEGSISPKYLVRLHRGIHVDALGRWVDFPVGMLAITKPSRAGDVLTIEAQGKESLAQVPVWKTLVLKKGTNKVEAIRTAMSQLCGEQFFRMADTSATLSADVSIGRDTTVWAVIKDIADSMNWLLFYDADGYLACRPPSTDPVFLFHTGEVPGGTISGDVSIGYGEDVLNLVWATGGTPSGKKVPIEAFAVAPPTHPLSPAELRRGGVDGYRRHDLTSDEVTKLSDLQAMVDRSLAQVLLQSVDLSFDSLCVWHLEEGDPIGVQEEGGPIVSGTFSSASIPLSPGLQSNGYLRKVSRSVRSIQKFSATARARA